MSAIGWIVLTWAVIIGNVWFLLHRYGKMWIVSIPGAFTMFNIVFNVIGAPAILSEYDAVGTLYIGSLNMVLMLHTIGYILADHIMKFDARSGLERYHALSVEPVQDRIQLRLIFFTLAALGIGVSVFYLLSVPSIPFIDMLRNPSMFELLAKSRETATTTFEGKYHRFSFFFRNLLPWLSLVALVLVFKMKKPVWIASTVVIIGFTVFMQVADLQKAPIISFFLSLLFLLFILRGNLEWKKLFFFIVAAILLLFFMYQFIMGLMSRTSGEILITIAKRLFMAQTKGIYTVFQQFPAYHDFLYGRSFPNPGGLLPFENFNLFKYLFVHTFSNRLVEGTAPVMYCFEFYANFGMGGLVVSALIGSMAMQLIQIFIYRAPKTVWTTGLFAFLIIYFTRIALSSFFDAFGFMFAAFVVILVFRSISMNILDQTIRNGADS